MNSTIGVVTDSHSSITQKEAEKLGIYVLPMPFYIDNTCYYEDINLAREEFFEKMKAGSHVSTSQPGPEEVMKIWEKALKEHEQILYIPLSSALSGSCQTAQMLAQEEPYAGRVFVVDNGRVSATQHRSVLDALELIEEGYTTAQIRQMLEEARANNTIYIGVQDLEYLKRGVRISRATAALGSVLNIKPVLQFDVGTMDTYKKCRGFVQAKKVMIDAMKQYGADSFVGRMSCVARGASDTTFYILAVYFGSVGITKTRNAVTCGLIADLAGIIAAIVVSYLFFF